MRKSIALAMVVGCAISTPGVAQQSEAQKLQERQKQAAGKGDPATPPKPLKPREDGLIPMNRQETVLVDRQEKRVYVETEVCNRDTLLEMFLCLKGRKQHESILALDGDAIQVHTALLMIGAEAGAPAKFRPKYIPSHGQQIDVFVTWKDKDGKVQRCRAQDWIQHSVTRYHVTKLQTLPSGVKVPFDELRYDTRRKELLWFGPMSKQQHTNLYELSEDKPYRAAVDKLRHEGRIRKMDARFIFSGSFFFENEDYPRFYTAEGGMVICVANLPEALLDINIASTDSDGGLAFETKTEAIPPLGTKVRIELIPVGPKPSEQKGKAAKKAPGGQAKTQPESKDALPENASGNSAKKNGGE